MSRPQILLGESSFDDEATRVLSRVGDVIEFGSMASFRKHLPEADAIVVGLEISLKRRLLADAKRLRVVATRTSRLLHIDMEEISRRRIDVLSNDSLAPAIRNTTSTAELAMALTLALARHLPWAFDSVKSQRWERSRFSGVELQGKTIGLIGFGRLGRKMSSFALAFGMLPLAFDPHVPAESFRGAAVEQTTLDELLMRSDIVSMHASIPATEEAILVAEHFRLMKPSAYFINTASGELVDEDALLRALQERQIAGAAIDTLRAEEADGSHLHANPLVDYAKLHDNLLLVPHLGGATADATVRTQRYIAERLADYLTASP
jgi:D-3-phosphoglycerate dehydrogenase / 2-oxoglutarate reductase